MSSSTNCEANSTAGLQPSSECPQAKTQASAAKEIDLTKKISVLCTNCNPLLFAADFQQSELRASEMHIQEYVLSSGPCTPGFRWPTLALPHAQAELVHRVKP